MKKKKYEKIHFRSSYSNKRFVCGLNVFIKPNKYPSRAFADKKEVTCKTCKKILKLNKIK